MSKNRLDSTSLALIRQKARLCAEQPFGLAVIFIPFMAVAVISFFVAFESTPRIRSTSTPFEYPADPVKEHSIWLSIGIQGDLIAIRTSDSRFFSWSANGPSADEFKNFQNYLRQRAAEHLQDTVRRGKVNTQTNEAALAVDQGLTFHHIRPVIYALASAGFSKYGFETRLIK
jgi:hypothetical protein